MANPWMKKNPWMSLWLSTAHQVANRAAGQAQAQAQAQFTRAMQEGTRELVSFWSQWMTQPYAAFDRLGTVAPAPAPEPASKRVRSPRKSHTTRARKTAAKRR